MPFDGVNCHSTELVAGPGERLVTLTRDYVALIDEADWPLVSQFSWRAHQARSNVYARHDTPKNADGRREVIYLHRLLVDAKPGWVVDHRNRHSLDCRRSNLRIAGFDQNTQNAEFFNSTGFRGVSVEHGRYRARIKHGGVSRSLGMYDTPEQAARAYDAAALERFGPYAWTNFEFERSTEKPLVDIASAIPF